MHYDFTSLDGIRYPDLAGNEVVQKHLDRLQQRKRHQSHRPLQTLPPTHPPRRSVTETFADRSFPKTKANGINKRASL